MGTTSLCPWSRRRGSTRIFLCPSSTRGPGTSFVSRDEWKTPSDDFLGEVRRLLRRWRALGLGALPSNFSLVPSVRISALKSYCVILCMLLCTTLCMT